MSSNSLQQLKPYLTEDEANEILEKYDKNRDGVLSKDELTGILLHLTRHPTQAANDNKVFSQTRAHSGPVKKPESISAKAPVGVINKKATKSNLQLSREQIKEVFREHDIDGDGRLSVGELTKAFGFLGSLLPFYKAHYGLAYADGNGDGFIGEDELDKLIDYAEKINKMK